MTLHITAFEGGAALSDFRVQQLLPRLQAVHSKITGLAARHVHLAAADHPLAAAEQERLAALLTYGEPWRSPAGSVVLVVTPRFGTVSPWASKATDIAHNCGLAVRRIERITEYHLTLKSGRLGAAPAPGAGELEAIGALLH